ncbi:MAG: hypothetical protein WDM70_06625 [Nitrosomonadales bacterium]
MGKLFTIHCIAWHDGAPLLQEVRLEANKLGLLDNSPSLIDNLDDKCRHALALNEKGSAIGCARITPEKRIDRIVVLPHEYRAQIETALSEMLRDYAS